MAKSPTAKDPTTVGAFDAKTNLSRLLERASCGEIITITRNGVPVAKLVPPDHDTTAATGDEVREQFRAFQAAHPLGADVTTRDMVQEGRRR